MQRLISPDYR